MPDDAELLHCYAAEGSEEAFRELVRRHLNLVYGAALRRTGGDAHRAEDVAQIVFTEVARKARALARHRALTAWLYATTRNVAIKIMLSENRRRAREAAAAIETDPPVDWETLRPILDSAMDDLGGADREAILLRYFENRPLGEVGAVLRVSEDAARMRVGRALDRLRALLARRGVTSGAAALAALLAEHVAAQAPSGMAGGISNAALSGGAASAGMAGPGLIAALGGGKLAVGGILAAAAIATGLFREAQRPGPSPASAVASAGAGSGAAPSMPGVNPDPGATDLAALVADLRKRGVPPFHIRSAVASLLTREYAPKLLGAMGLPEDGSPPPFWNSEVFQAPPDRVAERKRIETEMDARLRTLLGPDYFSYLDGPGNIASRQLTMSGIPEDVLRRFYRATDEALKQDTIQNGPVNPAGDRRGMLAAIEAAAQAALTPEEYAAVQVRRSQLRIDLAAFAPTKEEFDAIYRSSANPGQADTGDLEAALGPRRFAEYLALKAPENMNLAHLATRVGLDPASTVSSIRAIERRSMNESMALARSSSADPDGQRKRSQELAAATENEIKRALGSEGAAAYLGHYPILQNIRRE